MSVLSLLGDRWGVMKREVKPHLEPTKGGWRKRDVPGVQLDELGNDGQSQTTARHEFVHAYATTEDACVRRLRNAHTIVLNGDHQATLVA